MVILSRLDNDHVAGLDGIFDPIDREYPLALYKDKHFGHVMYVAGLYTPRTPPPDTDYVVAIIDSVLAVRCPAIVADYQEYSVVVSNLRYLNYIVYRNHPRHRKTINKYEAYFKGELP